MTEITIHEALPADAAAVAALVIELAQSMGESSPLTAAFAEDYLRSPHSHALLAKAGGQAVGLLSYSIRPDLYHAAPTALIEELVVRGPARRQGVGSALLRALFEHLSAAGCAEVSVTTMPDNEHALRFYRSHGLTDEAVFLERHLDSPEEEEQ